MGINTMADITDQHDQGSPSALDEHAVGNGNSIAGENRGVKRQRPSTADDDDDDDEPGRERRKIEIKFITDKSRRHITFSKRKAGIMKKAYELSVLTGTQVLLLVVSETGLVYTFTTPKLQPLVTKAEGKNLIQACLNAPACHNKLICIPTTCLRPSSTSRLSPTRIMLLNNREEVVIQCLPKAAFLSNIHTKHRAKSCIPVHGGSSLTLIPDT